MKTLSIAAAAAALSLGATQAPAGPFDGPWIGIEAAIEDYGNEADDGETAALAAGWDRSFGDRWVAGLALRHVIAGIDASETETTPILLAIDRVRIEDQWNLSARAGYRVTPALLVYGELGYERLDVEASRTLREVGCVPPGDCDTTITEVSSREELWTAGAGVEWAMTERLRLRGSYTYGDSDALERDRYAIGLSYAF